MTNLKDINFGMNQFCGPAVMSAITGKTTDECAAVISAITGKKEIRAVYTKDLMSAFKMLKFKAEKVQHYGYTLYAVISFLVNHDGMYVITVPKHFIAIEIKDKQIYIIDNHTKVPINAAASARLSQKVDEVYKITPRPDPVILTTEIEVEDLFGHISIRKVITFEDGVDNKSISMGHIYYNGDKELKDIIAGLLKVVVEKAIP